MRRTITLPWLVLLAALCSALPAGAQAVACTETAHVSWETNWDDVTVEAAIVEVPGCVDGDEVGIQLLTDDGDLPAEPMVGQVQDEHVRFDLSSLHVGIEPVTGVRVLLYGETIVEIVHIDVVQRFFSQSGNEQRGLLRTTELEVPVGGQYHVPGAPNRYEVAACSEMRRWSPPSDLVGQGAGTFTATEAGRHVVCYQQAPGTHGGRPDVDDPGVDETDVLGNQAVTPSTLVPGRGATGGLLASTGANLAVLALAALFLVVAGRRLSRVRAGSQRR